MKTKKRGSLSVFVVLLTILVIVMTAQSEEKDTLTIFLDASGYYKHTWVSLPYDSNYLYASDIYDEILSQGGSPNRIYHWIPGSDVGEFYSSRVGTNF